MDNPNRQPSNPDISPANHERVVVEDYRRPMNDLSVPPPNTSVRATEVKATSVDVTATHDSNQTHISTYILAILGWVCGVGAGGGTLYEFSLSSIITGRNALHRTLADGLGVALFCTTIAGFILCLAALLRFQGSTNQGAAQLRSWIGLILSAAAIVVSLLTYLGIV